TRAIRSSKSMWTSLEEGGLAAPWVGLLEQVLEAQLRGFLGLGLVVLVVEVGAVVDAQRVQQRELLVEGHRGSGVERRLQGQVHLNREACFGFPLGDVRE